MSRQELRSTGGNCQGDDRQESCSSAGNCQADEQTVIMQLSRPWSRPHNCHPLEKHSKVHRFSITLVACLFYVFTAVKQSCKRYTVHHLTFPMWYKLEMQILQWAEKLKRERKKRTDKAHYSLQMNLRVVVLEDRVDPESQQHKYVNKYHFNNWSPGLKNDSFSNSMSLSC